jgi:hypothetical protein
MADKKDPLLAKLEKQMVPFNQRLPALLRMKFAGLAEARGLTQVELLRAAVATTIELDAKIQALPETKRTALLEQARVQGVSIYEIALERAKIS